MVPGEVQEVDGHGFGGLARKWSQESTRRLIFMVLVAWLGNGQGQGQGQQGQRPGADTGHQTKAVRAL